MGLRGGAVQSWPRAVKVSGTRVRRVRMVIRCQEAGDVVFMGVDFLD